MLRIDGLSKTYRGNIRALCDVSLAIDRGLFGLLGPNGAGKSTLLRTLATLQLPDSGSATLDETDLINEPQQARQFIGYLPQEMGVYPRVSALEMLEYLAGLKGIGNRRRRRNLCLGQLERMGLAGCANRRLDTFSGGMRQRFGIASALLGDPKLIIVDEPTAGLDPAERRRFQLMLTETAKNRILILSSHIVEDIAGLCTSMALIDQGSIKRVGDPEQLTAELSGHVWEFETGLDQLEHWQNSSRLLSYRPHRGRLVIRVWKESDAPDGDEVGKRVEPSLEDLYAYHIESEKARSEAGNRPRQQRQELA